ncbi:MAG: PspA/IM30 family protein [Sphaerochaetaceae bacterium]|nr:PspA/IM30 family protein [Sphaerochaetaceae bacterium]MDC7247806.1 PspA/IM30 family protein [Sphaerochaetaceae bacterium]
MKMIKRFKKIMGSQINDRLDKIEDPEKMVKYMLREMDDTIVEAKSATTAKMALLTTIDSERKEVEKELERWQTRAQLAVEKGKDDLARQAIGEKQRVERKLAHLDEETKQMEQIIASMQSHVTTLEEKRDEVVEKQRILIQRAYHAKEKKKVLETLKGLDTVSTCRRFTEFEQKIERMEADAQMAGYRTKEEEKEAAFAKMEKEESIEKELSLLKKEKTSK